MAIKELIDNIQGKNNVGIIMWVLSLWSLIGILLFIPFCIIIYIMIALPMCLILEPKNTVISLSDYLKINYWGRTWKSSIAKKQVKCERKKVKITEQTSTQSKPFVLPFEIKKTLDYKPTIGVRGNQSTNSYIKLIRVIATGYFKSLLEDEQDFYESRFDNPTPAFDDRQVAANADSIGKFIHDFVWHIVSENTPISDNHRLLYGSKYTPLLLEITDSFHQNSDKAVLGTQRYVESLMDYYINIIISGEPIATNARAKQETPTTNYRPPTTETENDEKKEQWKFGLWEIIGVCVMIGIMYNGVIKDNISNKDTPLSKQQFDNAVSNIQSQGVENMHQSGTWRNSVSATRQLLGNNPSDEKINDFLNKTVIITNKTLPAMVDGNMQFISTNSSHKTMIYNYKLMDIEMGMNVPNNIIYDLKNDMMNDANMCANMGYILEYGVQLSYNYYAFNGDYLYTISILPRDCGY